MYHKTSRGTRLIILAAVIVMLVMPFIAGPRNNYLMNILVSYCYFGIMAASLNLINGYTGQINMGHGAFMAIGAYTYAVLSKTCAVPFALSLTAAVAHSFFWGLVLGLACCRLSVLYLAVATTGFSKCVSIFLINEGWLTGGASGFPGIRRLTIFGYRLGNFEFYYAAFALAVLCLVICYRLVYSKTGRAFIAVKSAPVAAAATGINVNKYKFLVCGISSAMAGLAGCIYALNITYLSPDTFNNWNIMFLTMNAVGGGTGNLAGPVIGTFVIGTLPELLRAFDSHLQGVYGILIIVIMVFMPEGIYGAFRKLKGGLR